MGRGKKNQVESDLENQEIELEIEENNEPEIEKEVEIETPASRRRRKDAKEKKDLEKQNKKVSETYVLKGVKLVKVTKKANGGSYSRFVLNTVKHKEDWKLLKEKLERDGQKIETEI